MAVTRSIRRKLVVFLALYALLFVVVAAPIISYLSYVAHKHNANQQQARLVGAVQVSAAIAAFVKNEEIAHDVLNGLLLDDEILTAKLLGLDGFSVDSSTANTATDQLTDPPTEYPLFSPVEQGKRIGGLFVWPNDPLITERAISSVKNDITWLVGLSFLLSIACILAANKLVGSPLRALIEQLSQIEPGSNKQIKIPKYHRNDEIGLVTESLNDFLIITRDAIDTERELRHKIEKLDEHYKNIFASTHVGIFVLNQNGYLLHNNPVLFDKVIHMDDSQASKLETEEFFNLVFKCPDEAWYLVAKARKLGDTVSADLELKSDGTKSRWVHCLISGGADINANGDIIEAVVYDVTSRIEEQSLAQKMAEEDPLTGLKNRRGCERYVEEHFIQTGMLSLTTMLLDLDCFKAVNDTFGHAAGDQVLITISERLKACTADAGNLIGRFGGDEFVVIIEMETFDELAIKRMAKNIIKSISDPINISSTIIVSVGVSIGIASQQNEFDFNQLLQAADEAMYKVKSSGKNNYAFAQKS